MEQLNNNSGENKGVQICLCDKTIVTELSGDFTLPDYQPEIRRLLKITACVQPPSKYVSMTDTEFTGNIDFYVLYCGSDGEIYCAPISSDYSVKASFDTDNYVDVSNGTSACALIVTDSVAGRVIAPRKLNIKCRLKTHVYVHAQAAMNGQINTDYDPSYTEKLISNTRAGRVMRTTSQTVELTDEIIPDSSAGEIRIISVEGKVLIFETNSGINEVKCHGEVYLKYFLNRENDTAPYILNRKIPFNTTTSIEGCDINCNAYAKGTVNQLNVTVEEGRILTSCGIIIEATAQKNEETRYIKDIYSTMCETNCEYKKMRLSIAGNSFNGNFTLGDSLSLEEAGINPMSNLIDISGNVCIDEIKFSGDKCIIQGKSRFSLQLEKDGDCTSSEIEFPIKFETESIEGMSDCEAYCDVVSCRGRIDGERVGVDAEISICGRLWGYNEISVLDGVKFGGGLKPRRGEYIICYPSPDDTLWSVAKRYAGSTEQISMENGLSNEYLSDSKESLDGVHFLII